MPKVVALIASALRAALPVPSSPLVWVHSGATCPRARMTPTQMSKATPSTFIVNGGVTVCHNVQWGVATQLIYLCIMVPGSYPMILPDATQGGASLG